MKLLILTLLGVAALAPPQDDYIFEDEPTYQESKSYSHSTNYPEPPAYPRPTEDNSSRRPPTTKYVPLHPFYMEKINEKYLEEPSKYPASPAYSVKISTDPAKAEEPISLEGGTYKTYPNPKNYETPPTYKHLPTSYPTGIKLKFSWTAWSKWVDCSVTCGTGITKRSRICLPGVNNDMETIMPGRYARDLYGVSKDESAHDHLYDEQPGGSHYSDIFIPDNDETETDGGLYPSENYASLSECEGDTSQIEQCVNKPCPVNGGWSKWEVWSRCSATCGDGGMQTRVRECNAPVPKNGGKLCQGVYEQSTLCSNPMPCPIDGNWNSWTPWCRCSISCGFGGIQTRGRNCSAPANDFGGQPCDGSALETRGCCEGTCPVNGQWSRWSDWSIPANTCGSDGQVTRSRRCDNPSPSDDGEPCRGRDTQSRLSILLPCPIDGCWGIWSGWSISGSSCGEEGFQTRSRACDDPAPQYDGINCIGNSLEFQIVKTKPCPIDGGWSKWFEWSKCSVSCGLEGTEVRKRKCNAPPPAYEGRPCEGRQENKRSCFIALCAVDGSWGPWSVWSFGNVTCGFGGSKSRIRECDTPSPQYGGKPCDGDASENAEIELPPCPVNGGWTAWNEWSWPTKTCGDNGGISSRSRECSNPKPAFSGANCRGANVEFRVDQLPSCPICGGWSEWSAWSDCSVTCGLSGITARGRICDKPAPSNGGDTCEGEYSQTKDCSIALCPISGGWSGWTEWSSCNASCYQAGLVTKKRFCDNPAPERGGSTCEGESLEFRSCTGSPCAVDGVWSNWGGWSRPSITCGIGPYPCRSRTCNNPAPSNGGRYCKGSATSYLNITNGPCPVDGGWSNWSEWSTPSLTCGRGSISSRSRTCSEPESEFGGKSCFGSAIDTKHAPVPPCPINGAWNEWSEYSICTVTCGSGGVHYRQRTCDKPAPAFDGLSCEGTSSEIRECSAPPCAIDGKWGKWSPWSEPSATCGADVQISRSRNCDNPTPANGGNECEGDSSSSKIILLEICPINGGWTEWTKWSTCSVKCGGGGAAKRIRYCANPEPQYAGRTCYGKANESKTCSGLPCGTDGGWTEWSTWSRYSVTCGEGGIVLRTRTCTQPSPTFGGRNCQGISTEYALGLAPPCAMDGGWSLWIRWSPCSVTCGSGGTTTRSRSCDAPNPSNGGKDCLGKINEVIDCFVAPCPIDGGWGSWSEWSKPTVLYGETHVQRTRHCDFPEPQFDGKPCTGDNTETMRVRLPPVPVIGGWSSWSEWGKPSASCGLAIVIRSRKCKNPVADYNGKNCKGEDKDIRAVKVKICPVDGNWGQWCKWSKCSVTCGTGGTATRYRLCNEPEPAHGGANCRGEDDQSRSCYVKPCLVDGGWSSWGQWSFCSTTCAEGTSVRRRACQSPVTAHGGRPCEGDDEETESCNLRPCDVDGSWSNWSDWSSCSVTCGEYGLTTRNRKCDNPIPHFFGRNCVGRPTEAKNCSTSPCAVSGGWAAWTSWSSCSKSCGYGGSTTRSRECNNPEASYGGRACVGSPSEAKYCFETSCNNWSPWTLWSGCTELCGIRPFHQRNRECLLQQNVVYGKNIIDFCEGETVEFKYCEKARHIYAPARQLSINVSGCGIIQGACVNNWFVIFNREKPGFNMNKNWNEFKSGFGTPPNDYHIGNEYIHCITKTGNYYGVIEALTKSGKRVDIESPNWVVASEGHNYALYHNSETFHQKDGLPFSTYDHDNDNSFYTNCAKLCLGGWWYDSCYDNINLFGDYKRYFDMKSLNQHLVSARILIQRLPIPEDVEIQSYYHLKYLSRIYGPGYAVTEKSEA